MGLLNTKAEWKFVLITPGALFLMTGGATLMVKLFVGNWVTLIQVSIITPKH